VALGSTLSLLAANVGKDATEVGTVFVTRGCGAIFGAVFSAKLYQWFPGNYVMFVGLLCISVLLVMLPFNKSNVVLHVLFLFLGVGTAITDTGCQIMTRKLHGKSAGPWLGANTVAVGISGAFVPLIEIFTKSIFVQYFALTLIVFSVSLLIGLGPNPEQYGRLQGGPPRPQGGHPSLAPHYNVEVVIGLMVFFFIGGKVCVYALCTAFFETCRVNRGCTHPAFSYLCVPCQMQTPTRPISLCRSSKVTTTAYIVSYVNATGVIDPDNANYLVLVLWIAITIGRLAGVYDQRFLTNKVRHPPPPLPPAATVPPCDVRRCPLAPPAP
jgi:hypothetical protein